MTSFAKPSLAVLLALLINYGTAYYLADSRILGGEDAAIEDYPYMVSLEKYGNYPKCGGSIISEKYIITAGHCVRSGPADYWIRAGANVTAVDGQVVNITNVTLHPNHGRITYDIAILELETPLQFSESVSTIKLPEPKELEDGVLVNVTGYGATEGKREQQLQVVQLRIVSREKCREINRKIGDDEICAALLGTSGKGPCKGDSGSPLSHEGVIYGIVSWGYSCGDPVHPAVFGNVVKFLPFIKEVTGLGP